MMDHPRRQKMFQQTIREEELDGFVVTHPANLRYLCGYTGSNGLLLFLDARPVFFTDGRYTQQAREEVSGARVVIAKGPLLDAAAKLIGRMRGAALGFEANYTSVVVASEMRGMFRKKIVWRPTSGLIMRQRLVKDSDELRIIRKAVKMGAEVYEQALEKIRAGVTESEVAGELELAARRCGAEGMSFETIVASGKRSALPHGRASNQPIARRGFVVIDSGVVVNGYCSDMTRTVHVGRASREDRRCYDAVLEAQLAGIAAVKAGVTAGEVDHAAREVLRKAKLDKFFTHSTGHGVGLEIHEPPRLGMKQQEQLRAGMVITIEPGVYVPNKGGVRIEDMVVVTEKGCEVLTPVTKELAEL
ncbi:MAG TPA: Xaa-Pro peptidase family protein [Terriglobales bacterium]|jgi:Xaa-Pro aminopeptidase|nr:Xaa-Pro peptidase family protein [Terriglobales bacterium]